ncbi:MAG: GNAT family N-acetyltransferase [Oscillospiraceae bacterium]|nr:GNAT family N-acetyltransferase [Oscillospiraceae bacterium]
MNLVYYENRQVSANQIAELRRSVGWPGMEECYNNPLMTSYYHIACYNKDRLVGYVDTVSNGLTDAYIQDLMVNPEYQGKGVGTKLINKMIDKLKENNIFMISVIYGNAELTPFYQRFGFNQMLCGQMQTYETAQQMQTYETE